MRNAVLLVDGRNLLWRVYETQGVLKAQVGEKSVRTGGAHGFLVSLLMLRRTYECPVQVVWEGWRNFRRDLWPAYKAHRTEDPDVQRKRKEVQNQQIIVQKLLRSCGVEQFVPDGGEADDGLATLARKYAEAVPKAFRVLIYSGDSDLRQVVSRRITVVSPGFRGKVVEYTPEVVEAKYGIGPGLIAAWKALAGDSSDGYPGIEGIGEKTASQVLQAYGSFNRLLKAAGEPDDTGGISMLTPRRCEALRANLDVLRVFYQLACVRDVELTRIAARPDRKELFTRLRKYSLRSLAAQLDALLLLGCRRGEPA